MLFSGVPLISLLAFAFSVIQAAPLQKKPAASAVAVDFKVVRESKLRKHYNGYLPKSPVRKLIEQNSEAHSISTPNEGTYYLSSLKVGSDDQEIGVILDTGSSDLWFPSKSSCEPTKTIKSDLSGLPPASSACPGGAFQQNSSSTYYDMHKAFSLYYGVEGYYSYAKGNWAKDTVRWGDIAVDQLQFGLATDQDIGQGILGLGYMANEGVNKLNKYSNFPSALKEQGIVNKNAYSLYLNSEDADAGSIIFGGIDEAKINGSLTYFDIVHVDDGARKTSDAVAFMVEFDGISQDGELIVDESYPGLLDSGSYYLYAPTAIYNATAPKYGTYNETVGGYITPCSTEQPPFSFHFNNLTVEVPFKNLLFNLSDDTQQFTDADGQELCLFSLLSSSEDIWLLGDVFMRSAYIYYDLDDNKIGLAQAVYTNETNIVTV